MRANSPFSLLILGASVKIQNECSVWMGRSEME